MASANEMRKKFYTEDGQKALFDRLTTLIQIYENTEIKYPFIKPILGFVPLSITSKEGLLHMINELRQVLGMEKINIEFKDEHGRVEVIEIK